MPDGVTLYEVLRPPYPEDLGPSRRHLPDLDPPPEVGEALLRYFDASAEALRNR